jgi:hypothetical protein
VLILYSSVNRRSWEPLKYSVPYSWQENPVYGAHDCLPACDLTSGLNLPTKFLKTWHRRLPLKVTRQIHNNPMKVVIFWFIARCSPYVSRRFVVMYHIHLQGRKSAEQETSVQPFNVCQYSPTRLCNVKIQKATVLYTEVINRQI